MTNLKMVPGRSAGGRWLRKRFVQAACGVLLGIGAAAAQAQSVDLVLNLSPGTPPTINASGTTTFTVEVDNSDPAAHLQNTATGVVVEFEISPTDTFVEAIGATCSGPDASNILVCNLGEIPYGNKVEFDVVVRGTGTGVVTFPYTMQVEATVTAENDANFGNNDETRTVTVNAGTDLGIALTSSPEEEVQSGGIWTHVMELTNHGPINATNVSVELDLPEGVVVVGTLPAGCSAADPGVICTLPSLPLGASHTFEPIETQIATASGSDLNVAANITGLAQQDDNASNDNRQQFVKVTGGSDLAVTLDHESGVILENQPFTITATPSYTGEVPDLPELVITVDPGLGILNAASFIQNGWSCSVAGQLVTCSGLDVTGMEPGANQPLGVVVLDVMGPVAGTYDDNHVVIRADYTNKPDPNPDNNEDGTDPAIQAAELAMGITKTGPLPPFDLRTIGAAYPFNYTVTVNNSGNIDFWGDLTWTDTVPAGLTVTAVTPPNGWSCVGFPVTGSGSFTCSSNAYEDVSPLAKGGSVSFTVTAYANGNVTGDLVNEACLTTIDHELNFLENEVARPCDDATINAQTHVDSADLRVVKTANPSSVEAGEALTYTLEVVNTGPAIANTVTLTDVLSDLFTGAEGNSFLGATVTAGSATGASCTNGEAANVSSRTLNCVFETVPVCTQGTNCPKVEVTILPLGQQNNGSQLPRPNTANAYSSVTADPNYSNNTDDEPVTITAQTDLRLSKEVTTFSGELGTPLIYRIQVFNEGASGANTLTMTDTLPDDLTFIQVQDAGGGSCTAPAANSTTAAGNNEIVCTRTALPRDATWTVVIETRPNHGLEADTVLKNVAKVETTTLETDLTNNEDEAEVTVIEAAVDLAVTKFDIGDPVYVGDKVTYELQIINNGPSVATAATIYDYLPSAGLNFVEGSLKFYRVAGGSRGTEISLEDQASLGISCSKQPAGGAFGTGQPEQNLAESYLWPMHENPDYLNGVWDPSKGNLQEDADLICNMGLLGVGEARIVTYELEADERGVYFNYAISRSQEHRENGDDGPDTLPTNDVARERTTVRSVPDVALEKEVSQPKVSLREPFSYTITVRNNHALQNADFPEVRDSLPANIELTGTPTLLSGTLAGGDFACWPDSAVEPEDRVPSQAGDTAFACSLGEGLPPASTVVIEVPVRVAAGSVATLTNKAFLHLDTDLEFDTEPDPVLEDEVNVDVVVSSISGYVYHDIGNDGVRNNEPPIAGVTIRLSGTEDDSGNSVSREMQTDANGYYEFDDLAPGIYTIEEVHPSNWVDGKDTVGLFAPDEPGTGVAGDDVIGGIVLPADTHGIEYNFGEVKELPAGEEAASVSGYVYHDRADDGVRGDNPPIPYVEIVLSWGEGDETQTRTTVTDDSGYYYFGGLEPGVTYTITEVQPEGWRDGQETVGEGFASGGESPENDVFVVTPGSGEEGIEFNFGELRPLPTAIPVNNPWALLLLMLLLMGTMARSRMRR